LEYLKINNWEKWQTYRKDRGQPPWIKIHRRIMRNPEWVSLSDSERGQLVAIWLLAADHDGVIPASPDLIQKLCFMTEPPNINKFIELDFILSSGCQDGVKMASNGCQYDTPKAEAKAETEEERPALAHNDDIPIPLAEKKEATASPADAGLKILSGGHFTNNVGEYLDIIVRYAEKISTLNKKNPPFNPYKFIQYQLKNKTHPGAIYETLESISKQWDQVLNPWSYGVAVIKTKNGNWYEKEKIKEFKEVERVWDNLLKENPKLMKLITNAMKGA